MRDFFVRMCFMFVCHEPGLLAPLVRVSARYRSGTPLVLKGINLDIASGASLHTTCITQHKILVGDVTCTRAGQRIGVVGRTGSGKSSLLLCLMRLVEPELKEGQAGAFVHHAHTHMT